MTKEQKTACEASEPSWVKSATNKTHCKGCFADGFQAAQNPDNLLLNPLVKGLEDSLRECIGILCRTYGADLESERMKNICKVLAPFKEVEK